MAAGVLAGLRGTAYVTHLLEWLLDLERIRLGSGAPLSVHWQFPIASWILFGFSLLLLVFTVLVYRREIRGTASGGSSRWMVPAALRTGILALVVILLCQPVLVLQRERVEPSWVALLVDTSHSMNRHERYQDEALAASIAAGAGLTDPSDTAEHSRLELVRRALLKDRAAALRAVLEHHQLHLASFAGATQARGLWKQVSPQAPDGGITSLAAALDDLVADGTATDLHGALTEVLAGQSTPPPNRLAAILLASDARSTVPSILSVPIDLAKAQQVPVLPLRVGSPQLPVDVSVGPVVAEDNVFLKDLVAIRADVAATGLNAPTPLTVRLIDEQSAGGRIASTEVLELGGDRATGQVEFRVKPARTGSQAYRVEVAPLPAEHETDDNVDRVEFRVLDDKLRVLYVEGYPRFEYRYLKNVLLREETIRSSILLLSADTEFAQEGSDPIRRFPGTAEELGRYDVVLLGDVDPTGDWLSPAQAQLLVEFVGDHGGGFGLIAGERHAPHRYRGTVLERLIPVRIDPEFLGRYDAMLATTFHPRLTPEGRHSRLFRFERDRQVSEQLFESLPGLYWIARTLGPRPGAEVLAEAAHRSPHAGAGGDGGRTGRQSVPPLHGEMPLVVVGRYGAGKLLFTATDDTWRWRRHTGEFLHDAYWVQLCRTLMRPSDPGRDRRLRVRPDRRRYAYGDRVELRVEVTDAELLSSLDSSLTLVLLDARSAPLAKLHAERVDPSSSVFEAWLVPGQAGTFTIRCPDVIPRPGEKPASATIRVETADLEARRPEADHGLLTRLAEQTDGQVVDLDKLPEVLARIRERSVAVPDDISEPLWDSKLVLVLFVSMITIEWVLRKAFGML